MNEQDRKGVCVGGVNWGSLDQSSEEETQGCGPLLERGKE